MPRKILVVDDYEDARQILKFILRSLGYLVAEAADGSEAVESVKGSLPDLILMDLAMPVMNGIEAVKAIRKFENGSEIPIICLTAYGNQFYDEAIEAGFNEVIAKPVDYDSLPLIILRHLEESDFP
jgi:CheY-like chemotaxis protein